MKCVSPDCKHELGYLTKVENDGCNEILYLNEEILFQTRNFDLI